MEEGYVLVPTRLSTQTEDHSQRHSEKRQARTLHVEPVFSLEYDRKGLEGQIENSKNQCVPVEDISRPSQYAVSLWMGKQETAHHIFNSNSIRFLNTTSVKIR